MDRSPAHATKLLKLILGLRREGIHDANVLAAMEKVPREEFVGASYRHLAYENQTLPIAAGQTISQPFVVAKMSQELALTPDSRVLEIGTGSGYQAAVLSHLCRRVSTIERQPELFQTAKARLMRLDMYNVDIRLGDGFAGWPESAPFDAIIVTCAPESVPENLFAQLNVGGRLVAPIGHQQEKQELRILTKIDEQRVTSKTLGLVRFVPMLGGVAKV